MGSLWEPKPTAGGVDSDQIDGGPADTPLPCLGIKASSRIIMATGWPTGADEGGMTLVSLSGRPVDLKAVAVPGNGIITFTGAATQSDGYPWKIQIIWQ